MMIATRVVELERELHASIPEALINPIIHRLKHFQSGPPRSSLLSLLALLRLLALAIIAS